MWVLRETMIRIGQRPSLWRGDVERPATGCQGSLWLLVDDYEADRLSIAALETEWLLNTQNYCHHGYFSVAIS